MEIKDLKNEDLVLIATKGARVANSRKALIELATRKDVEPSEILAICKNGRTDAIAWEAMKYLMAHPKTTINEYGVLVHSAKNEMIAVRAVFEISKFTPINMANLINAIEHGYSKKVVLNAVLYLLVHPELTADNLINVLCRCSGSDVRLKIEEKLFSLKDLSSKHLVILCLHAVTEDIAIDGVKRLVAVGGTEGELVNVANKANSSSVAGIALDALNYHPKLHNESLARVAEDSDHENVCLQALQYLFKRTGLEFETIHNLSQCASFASVKIMAQEYMWKFPNVTADNLCHLAMFGLSDSVAQNSINELVKHKDVNDELLIQVALLGRTANVKKIAASFIKSEYQKTLLSYL